MGYYIQSIGMSMKYFLIIWVCAFLNPGDTRCLDPVTYPTAYNSWYECSRAAHMESIKLVSKMGYKYVNDMKIGTRYTCLSKSGSI